MFLHIWVVLFILLNSISLYGRTTVCLPMHQLLDHWVLSRFLLWKNCSKLLYKVFVWTYVFISLEEYLQTKWLSCGKCILNFIRKWQIVLLSGCTILHFQQQCIHTKTVCVCVCVCVCMSVCSCSVVSDSVIPWSVVACQAPLSIKFYSQEYWSG